MKIGRIEFSPNYRNRPIRNEVIINGTELKGEPDQLLNAICQIELHASNDEIRDIFLTLWDRASKSPDYNKAEWNELRRMLKTRGIDT